MIDGVSQCIVYLTFANLVFISLCVRHTCACVCVHVCACEYALGYKGQSLTLGIFLYCFLPYFLRQGLSLHPGLVSSGRVADQRVLSGLCLCSPSNAGECCCTRALHASTRNPNSGPHAHVASTSGWEPWPLSYFSSPRLVLSIFCHV